MRTAGGGGADGRRMNPALGDYVPRQLGLLFEKIRSTFLCEPEA